jgi:response regulator NasT
MATRLRIAVADDEPDVRDFFQRVLPRLGHEVVAVAENGQQLLEACRRLQPDLVITDIVMPVMDGITAAEQICQERPVPTILVSAYYENDFIQRAEASSVMGYLVKPIKQADLGPAIAIAQRRFEQLEQIRREAADLRQALHDRKIIERAKGVVMQWCQCDEPTAFRRLQKLASDRNRKLVEVADAILVAAELWQDQRGTSRQNTPTHLDMAAATDSPTGSPAGKTVAPKSANVANDRSTD